jgi:uncharacterized protein YllA (UPF0747 family)
MLLTVTNSENADRFAELLSPLLEPHGLMLLISEIEVLRGERF